MALAAVCVVWPIGRFGGAKHLGEHANKDNAQCGEARANDSDVNLDVGPVDDVGLIPGWVG